MADHYAVLVKDHDTFDEFIVGPFFLFELAVIWAKQDADEKNKERDLKTMDSSLDGGFIVVGDGEEVLYEWEVYKMVPTT